LDYGCGSGYIGLAVAKNILDASKVDLYDISEKAVEMSTTNMSYNNLNDLNITNDNSKLDDKFTNIIFYQPFLTTKEYNEKIKEGQDLRPKEAYVISKNMYKNFAKFCSSHISENHYLILLSYINEDTFNSVKQEFEEVIPNCKVEMLKYNSYKFITIRNS
jgi:methylase of polypeptide subunit release factors